MSEIDFVIRGIPGRKPNNLLLITHLKRSVAQSFVALHTFSLLTNWEVTAESCMSSV